MHSIQLAIIRTLCYADIFDYPLTQTEVTRKLIAGKVVPARKIVEELHHLHDTGIICQSGPYYHFPKRGRIVGLRTRRTRESQQKSERGKAIAHQLARLPYVVAIFMTGSTAVGNAPHNDDIDLMVITAQHSLWTSRVSITLWLELHGVRRRPHDHDNNNKICMNLFLTPDSLAVPEERRNLYTAHEVIQVKPLVDPSNFHARFLKANQWVKTYLPNAFSTADSIQDDEDVSLLEAPSWIETTLRRAQQGYMRHKKTREMVTPEAAYFHPRDTAGIVLTQYQERLKHYE